MIMKQSVFNLNTLKAHPERNAFDLSHNDVFSCAPGMLLPISCTEVLPNEHYEINPQIFLRTMPLNSAAFVRMRQHMEFFFVPMRLLCRQFNQFVVGTKYPTSSLDTINAYDGKLPKLSLLSSAPPIIIKLPLIFSFKLSPHIMYFLFYPIVRNIYTSIKEALQSFM